MFDLYGSLKGIWYPNTRHFLQCFCDPIQKWKNVLSKGRNSHGCKAVICKIPCIDCKAVKLSFFCILAIHARQLSKKLSCIEFVPLKCCKIALLTSDIARHFSPLQGYNSRDCKAVKILLCMLAMFPRTCKAVSAKNWINFKKILFF